ncbi:MAG: SDR family NAD(P)-dependent oxidoreductase [Thermoleophilaceae bacterium]
MLPAVKLGPETRVLLTGASRGIGEALARSLAARGCVMGLVARSGDELEALVASLPGEGHQALPADVGDREAVFAAAERFGETDVVVANAGVANYGAYASLDADDEERMTRVNWLGTLHTVRAVLPGLIERGRGHVVIVSSGAALRTFPQAAVYGATKAAQRGFSEALRHELHGTGVSVTTVYPGEIKSHLHDHERETMPAWYRKNNAADAGGLVAKIIEGVEQDKRGVYHPPIVRLLRIVHGISPRAGDLMLRGLRGKSAAPRQ